MTERAAHLVDAVLPRVPVRQWVLTMPYRLRYQMAWDHGLSRAVLGVYTRVLLDLYAQGARERGFPGGRTGTVTAIQRSASGLNVNIHFSTCWRVQTAGAACAWLPPSTIRPPFGGSSLTWPSPIRGRAQAPPRLPAAPPRCEPPGSRRGSSLRGSRPGARGRIRPGSTRSIWSLTVPPCPARIALSQAGTLRSRGDRNVRCAHGS